MARQQASDHDTEPAADRRLAAILAADLVGYSRMISSDEAGALARLRSVRSLIEANVARGRGRIFKTMGDGVLAEFPSAVLAVQCALDIQAELQSREEADRRALRIGVHQGEVVVDGDDLLGDGVNVAARLEAFSIPGGICVSSRIYEDVVGKIAFGKKDLGRHQLKNIARPLHVYALRPLHDSAGVSDDAADGESDSASLPLPDKPSIAVLPFINLSNDPDQDYFADGVVDDIINALSRGNWLFVIGRNSSFTYKGRQVGSRDIGRELGVRYLLEGSIRVSGPRLRLNGQLVEAETGHNLWADRFEGKLDDIFDLQDRITERVVCSIEPRLRHRELERLREKPTESLEAYDLCLRALPNIHVAAATLEKNDECLRLLHRAITIDPNYALARALAAWAHFVRKAQGWSTPDEDAAGAALAEMAFAQHRDDPHVLGCAGHAFAYLTHRLDFAKRTLERAIMIAPNSLRVLNSSGWIHIYTVEPEVSLDHFQRAIRLSPVDPEVGYTLSGMAFSYSQLGRYEEGRAIAQKAIDETPNWTSSYRGLIINLVGLGRIDEARRAARRLMKLDPHICLSKMWRFTPVRSGTWVNTYADALRLSGIPE